LFKLNIMADSIFDAQRDRRIQNLQQQSVSNIVRSNPNLRGVLSRYEDAEVSRLKLLELQQMRSKKITAGEKALLKTLRKGRRATGGRGGKGKQKKEKTQAVAQQGEPPKSQTQIEVDAEEKREKLRLEKVKQRQDEDFRRDRLQIEDRQEVDRLNEQRDIAREGRIQKGQLAATERGQRQIQFEAGLRQQLAIEDRTVVRSEAERDARIRESDNKLRGVQERVARDDAFRHAQLQETQRLALEQLAGQQRDNERAHREQQLRIDNQRAVNADRAVSDRELIGGLQGRITQLERQQFPAARGKVEDVEEETPLALASGQPGGSPTPRGARSPEPEPQPEPTLSAPAPRASTPPRAPPAAPAGPPKGAPPPGSQQRRPVRGTAQKERDLRARAAEGLEPSTNLRSRRRPDGTLLSQESSALEITEPAPRSSTPPRSREVASTPAEEAAIAQAYRSNTPEVFRPIVKELAQVRRENPVEGGGE
jgi:hypothetical protein